MKKILYLFLTITLCSFGVSAQNGAIKGRVLDDNNLGMPGALVMIKSIDKNTVTDVKGNFDLLNIPVGSYSISISFMGYEDYSTEVEVTPNSTSIIKANMNYGVLIGDEVLILGDRLKGQAKALNDQKNKMNISNVVAADQVGRFPDANIGDALKRIPGITMQNDQGEARNIIIRGMAPQLNSVTLNGERIPSAEGDNRNVQMDLIPSDMIQMIEVNKVLTPDMDADAIGGSVNLVTRSAPEGFRVSGTLASGYNFLSNKPIWTGAVILGNRFFNNKLGAIVSGSYNEHDFGSHNVEAEWVDSDELGALVDVLEVRTYQVKRTRRSVSLGLDYQLNANNTLYFNGMYNSRDDWENRFRVTLEDIEDGIDDFGASFQEPGLIETFATVERQTKGGIGNNRVNNSRLEDQRTMNFSLRGDHLLVNKIKLNWSGTYTRASEKRPNERYVAYVGEEIPVVVDFRNPRFPHVTEVAESSWEGTEFDELTEEFQDQWEEDLNAKVNLQIPVDKLGIVKFGGTYRSKTKRRSNNFFEYTPIGGSGNGDVHPDFGGSWDAEEEEFTDLVLNEITVDDKSNNEFLVGDQYQAGLFADEIWLGQLDLNNGNLYEAEDKPEEYVPGNYTANEDVVAGYIMADFQLSEKLSTVFGVRVENTSIDYTGFSIDVEDDEVPIVRTTGNNSYTNVLPGIQMKYDFSKNTILRLAWTNALSRPDYFALVPFEEYNSEDQELVLGNPALNPATSMNVDFMLENYFKSIGLVSGGFFYKNIDDFIYERVEPDYAYQIGGSTESVELVTWGNGGTANVTGFELAFQRQLDFLPGALKGFGVYLNYTFTNSETTGIEGREGEELDLPGTAKNMYNFSLSYETEKLVMRASLNHATDYLDELGGDSFEDRFYDKQTFLDFNASYAISKNWRIFVELNNLTNQPLRYYQGIAERTMQTEYYSRRMNFGVKFDLFGK